VARASAARRQAPAERAASRTGAEFSVQVAAFNTRGSATALVKRLSELGFSARIVGTQRPYRVRVGRYATRQLAEDALRRMRAENVDGVVVQAEARR
jgi:cell division protein FtsN